MTGLLEIPAADAAGEQLAVHRGWLRRGEELAEDLAGRERHEDAVAVAAIAAQIALFAHPGVMVSPRLDRVLERVAARSLTPVERAEAPARPPRRVLHVVTETYGTGGHTRILWRWIARDRERTHSVVTTHQAGAGVAAGVRKAVERSGGRVVELPPQAPMLRRAQRVRELAAEADVVVLHAHTCDPMPTLALSGMDGRPPVLLNDHAGTSFWFGRPVADVVIAAPPQRPAHTVRHGIPAERYVGSPFPVSGTDGHGRDASAPLADHARNAARRKVLREYGWPADTVLLFTAGDGYKYNGPAGAGFLDLVEPVLAQQRSARLLAAGPQPAERWEAAGPRVRALGHRSGLEVFYAAADVYLDSYPFGGNGSAAEAASHGVPVLACAGGSPLEGEVCRAQPCFGAHVHPDAESYRAALERLIGDSAERRRCGELSREAIAAIDAGWNERLERTYARAAEVGPVGPLPDPEDEPQPVDMLVHLMQQATGQAMRPEAAEPVLRTLELAGRRDDVRGVYGSLCGPAWRPVLVRQVPVAFAAPPAEPAALRELIEDFATMAAAGIVTRGFTIAMRPQDAGAAVPVLEEALAAHPELTVDLVLQPDPRAARPLGALELA